MNERKLKVGDVITGKPGNGYNYTTEDAIMEVIDLRSTQVEDEDIQVKILEHKRDRDHIGNTYWVESKHFTLVKGGREKMEDTTKEVKYLVYGTGCDNRSRVLDTEKQMKTTMEEKTTESSWSGNIIGYKMIPICIAEPKVIFKKITPSKKKGDKK